MKSTIRKTVVLILTAVAVAVFYRSDTDSSGTSKAANAPEVDAVPKVTIPEGTKIRIALIDSVGTSKNSPGDPFAARVVDPIVLDGKVILEKGTTVRGRITDVNEFSKEQGRARIRMILTTIICNGKDVRISTKPFVQVADNSGPTKNKDLNYPPETRLSFTLANALEI
jgi:hypothetical protein